MAISLLAQRKKYVLEYIKLFNFVNENIAPTYQTPGIFIICEIIKDSRSLVSRGDVFIYEVEHNLQKFGQTFFASPPRLPQGSSPPLGAS